MKNIKFLTVALFSILFVTACSNDDDVIPTAVNEEEVITTLTVTLSSVGVIAPDVTLKTQDLDGDGPNDPIVSVVGNLIPGVTYNGVIELLNETEDPAENITEEVEGESDKHQFFYTIGGNLDLTTTYTNFDGDGNPLGTEFSVVTGAVSSGTMTFTLRHEPIKPNTGLDNAGGETDISAIFNVSIQ